MKLADESGSGVFEVRRGRGCCFSWSDGPSAAISTGIHLLKR
jgi:hypothetical protein